MSTKDQNTTNFGQKLKVFHPKLLQNPARQLPNKRHIKLYIILNLTNYSEPFSYSSEPDSSLSSSLLTIF